MRSTPCALGLLLGGALGLGACAPDGPFLQVSIEGIPEAAASITAYTLLNDRIANQTPTFPTDARTSLVMGLLLDRPAAGALSVAVGAQDEGGCLLATGDVLTAVREQDTVLKLELPLSRLAMPLCETRSAAILGAEPGQISTAGRTPRGERGLDVLGWGFRPGTTVRIGGVPQCATLSSARRLHVDAPVLVQPPGPALIEVQVPGAEAVQSASSLIVNMAPIEAMWRPPQRYAPSAELLDVAAMPQAPGLPPQVLALDRLGQGWLYRFDTDLAGDRQLTADPAGRLFTLSELQLGQSAALAAADLDGDGRTDLAVVSPVGSFLLRRTDSGALETLASRPTILGQDAALADLDGDGRADWLVAGDALRVYRNPGDGRFADVESQRIELPTAALAVADLDGDGAKDVVAVAAPPSPLVRVLYNRGGLLTEPRDYAVRACPASNPRPGLVVALLDDDSLPDLAVNGSAALLLNRGGSFEYRYIGGVTPCFGGSAVAAADLKEN
ncbi:MAG: VCBS repeat-containing protein [Polyangia bacterium]